MSIRYFSKWLQDEERSFADWRNPWAWLDLNVTDPPPGVIYLTPRPIELSEEVPNPLLIGQADRFELSSAITVDGGSSSFIIRRSTVYIFKFCPLVILVLGIITNAIQLALCCRLRRRLPGVVFLTAIAIADLVSVLLGSGRLAIDRLFGTSLDHLHPWSCKMRHFLLASALDLSAWLVPLGLCELWRPANRLIIYATVMSLLLNLHNLVTRGWQVQGDFGLAPIMNDCGFSFPDARIFWIHVHPIVSVIINVIGPIVTAMLLVTTLTFQGRCHPVVDKKYDVKHHKKPHQKVLRINLLVLFAVLAVVQAIFLAPTAVLSAMELFLDMTVHPSMRALVLFAQLLNCVIKLPFIFLAAPQLCPAVNESAMNFSGEKSRKKVVVKTKEDDSDSGEQSGLDEPGIADQSSLVNYNNKKHNKYEEVIDRSHQLPIDGKQLNSSTMSRINIVNSSNRLQLPPPPPPLLSTVDPPTFHRHHHHYHHHNGNNQPMFPAAANKTPLMATNNASNANISLTTAAINALSSSSTLPLHFHPQPQLYWLNEQAKTATGESNSRKIYV